MGVVDFDVVGVVVVIDFESLFISMSFEIYVCVYTYVFLSLKSRWSFRFLIWRGSWLWRTSGLPAREHSEGHFDI